MGEATPATKQTTIVDSPAAIMFTTSLPEEVGMHMISDSDIDRLMYREPRDRLWDVLLLAAGTAFGVAQNAIGVLSEWHAAASDKPRAFTGGELFQIVELVVSVSAVVILAIVLARKPKHEEPKEVAAAIRSRTNKRVQSING